MTSVEVDTGEVRRAASVFASAAEQLAALNAAEPLRDAVAAVPELRTARACTEAAATVSAEMSTVVTQVRSHGAGLASAADRYDATDSLSAGVIDGVQVPPPAPR